MFRTIVLASLLLSFVPLSTSWAQGKTGIGANLGFTHYIPEQGDGLTLIGWPSGGNFVGLTQPGLRLSFLGSKGLDEIYLDSSMSIISQSGESFSMFVGTVNYQRNFAPPEGTGAYVTAGLGIAVLSFDGFDSSNPILGAGLGVRRGLAHGNGSLRGEIRLDRLFEDDDGLEGLTEIGLRLGFDLWPN
jgi:hypothetical protein